MKQAPDARLDALRGSAERLPHNARTLAALENNPRCSLRAVLDASGADKAAIATHAGYPSHYGQSRFALARGASFEKMVKANGCAELLRVLREILQLPVAEAGYQDLEEVGGRATASARVARTTQLLVAAGQGRGGATLYDHPLLRLEVGGHPVLLEPDLVAFRAEGRFYVVEIKSFPIVDGSANPLQVRSATTQACAYVIALRAVLTAAGLDPGQVSDTIVLVGPKDFTNRPTGAFVDARKPIAALTRQMARIDRVGDLLELLPEGLTFDLALDAEDRPRRPVAELLKALETVPTAYRPECLSHCDLAFYCRSQARRAGSLDVLGPVVLEQLGGIDTVSMALGLARGDLSPNDDQVEVTVALRHAARLRAELDARAVGPAGAGS